MEKVLPIYKVENDTIISRKGDITLAFELTLPEIFTCSTDDFEALHHAWVKAIRLLPPHTILHKQDYFIEAEYWADFTRTDASFLARSSDRYFNERPHLDHASYLFITKKPAGRKPASNLYSALIRPHLVPDSSLQAKERDLFLEKAGQCIRILQDSGYISIRRLSTQEIAGKDRTPGLLERYCYLLHPQEEPVIRDIQLSPEWKIGNAYCQLFSLADPADMPALCGPRTNYDRYSTDRTKFSIAFATPLGQLLPCNHIYNQFIIVEEAQATLSKLESRRLRLQSLSAYSRENAVSRDATDQYLHEAVSDQRTMVKAHFNIMAWTDQHDQVKDIKNTVSAALAQLDARTRQETASAAQLFWAALPGNEADLPSEDTFHTFAEQATCFLTLETNYRSSRSPFGIRLGDRISGLPVHVDISDEPIRKGICTNRNKFILGPSGGYRVAFY